MNGTARERKPRQRGFTMIETVVVMMLLSLLFIFAIPNLELLSPKYSLRAGARNVGSAILLCRGEAIAKQRTYAILYELDSQTYSIFAEPGPADPTGYEVEEPLGDPGPWGTYRVSAPRRLPDGVRLVAVMPDVSQAVTGGHMAVRFSPLGFEGSHVVLLENSRGERMSVKYNAVVGVADYREGEVGFRRVGQ